MDSVNLGPILFKRLHIEGSTLRSRSLEYQADLVDRYVLDFLLIKFHCLPCCFPRFKSDIFSEITGEGGRGPIRTYIHKASNTGPDLILTDINLF